MLKNLHPKVTVGFLALSSYGNGTTNKKNQFCFYLPQGSYDQGQCLKHFTPIRNKFLH